MKKTIRQKLLKTLSKKDIDVARLGKYTDTQLKIMLAIDLKKRVRTAFDGQECRYCGLVYRMFTAFTKCPRCSK